MRKMNFMGSDIDFYQKTAFSTWVLATGNTGFQYFNNIEPATERNYTKGQNFFEQNQGRVLGYKLTLLDAVGAEPTWTLALATAWGTMKNQMQILTNQDSTVSDVCLGYDLAPAPPSLVGVAAIANYDGGSLPIKPSGKAGKYFEPPLFVANGRSIDIAAILIGGTVPAALNTFKLRLYAYLEELPQTNIVATRQ